MIVKMERLYAFGLISDKEKILNMLIRKRCVQLIEPVAAMGELPEAAKTGTADVSAYQEELSRYAAALGEIKRWSGKRRGRKPEIPYNKLESAEIAEAADAMCVEIETLTEKISELKKSRELDTLLQKSLGPWASSSIPLETTSTDSLEISYYLLPPKADKAVLPADLEDAAPASHIEYIHEDKEQKYAVVMNHKECSDAVWDVMERHNAVIMHFGGILHGTPQKNLEEAEARLAEYEKRITELEDRLKELGKNEEALRCGYDSLLLKIRLESINSQLVFTETVFGLSGWVPEYKKHEVEGILNEYNCVYEFQAVEPEGGEDPPVLFKNNKFVEPFEYIVQMYALPQYDSIDPTKAIAPFFSLFYGMMLSDAGYGIVMVLLCTLGLKFMDMGKGMQSICKALRLGGASAIFWGAVYGSWFGDIVEVVAKTFFNMDVHIPYLVNPLWDPMTVLVLSLVLGVVHLFVGLGLKAYLLIRRGHIWSAVFDVGFWYFVISGLGLMLLGGGMVSTVGTYLAAGGAIGLVLTQGRNKKGIIMKILSGTVSLYGIVNYFSDILSYSRILALGLSTAVIASVVNTMGSMMGGTLVGALVLFIVFAAGHALNLLINAFSAYVHTVRLQYVEFFDKFYESGGKPFGPFEVNTKYCHVYE